MPVGIEDRNADVWEALLSVAEAAGGDWPERARVSAVSHVSDAKAATPSLGIRLLADLRTVFVEREAMFTTEIIRGLCDIEDSPWGDLKGKPIDGRRVSRYLDAYGVTRKQIRVGDKTGKGYTREDLYDPWNRYLGPSLGLPALVKETSETLATCVKCDGEGCAWCETAQ
jgi:hypothetical protein